jgi:hypothetical protein
MVAPANVNHLGISEAGKTTVLNQIRLLSGYAYSLEEYDNCRRLLWNTLVDDFILVLNELSGESQWVRDRATIKGCSFLADTSRY